MSFSCEDIYSTAFPIIGEWNGRILDCGAGQGITSNFLKELGKNVFACDLHPELFRVSGVKCVYSDLNHSIRFPANYFDNVVCLEVIEHLNNPKALIGEIKRVLKPFGGLLLSTPNIACINSRLSLLVRGKYSQLCQSITLGMSHQWLRRN